MTPAHRAQTVCIVDDDASVRRAVERLVRSDGLRAKTFDSAEHFLGAFDPMNCGCLVLDITMPGINGLALQAELARIDGTIPILFLTGTGDIPQSVRAMKGGAADFLSKPCPDEQLLGAIRSALEERSRSERDLDTLRAFRRRLVTLTPREHEVMLCVIAGKLNKQTAAELGTTEKTIKVHRGRVMTKLAMKSLADLVRLAERAGLTGGAR